MDLWVLIVGLLMLVVALPVAGRRVLFLFRLITSGQPAPDRVENVTQRLGQAIRSQVVEVFAQRKLLKWSVPGAAHFFVFWAFLILGHGLPRGLRHPLLPRRGVGDPGRRALGRARVRPGLHRRDVPGRPGDVRRDPAAQRPAQARPQVPVQRLAPRRRLGDPGDDRQRHLDDVPVPRRGRRREPGNLPYGAGAFVSAGDRQAVRRSERATRSRSSRASACCSTSA